MPTIALTDLSIKAIRAPEKGQVTYTDTNLPGFGVRVSQGGSKTFTVVFGANRQRVTIGKYGVISLSDARKEARSILAEHTLGRHRLVSISFADARDAFLRGCEQKNKPRTVADYKRTLDRHFRYGRVPLPEIKKHDVMRRIEKLRDTPRAQNYAFVVARAFFRWAVRHGYLERSQLEGLGLPARNASRDRTLSADELQKVYRRARETPYPFGPIVMLLILTGQRRGEIVALRWDWIDQDAKTITLPASITKNSREHCFPYGDAVAAVLNDLPHLGEYLFPARTAQVRGKKSSCFNGWSKAKKTFDEGLEDVEPYTLHDLRRSFSSMLAALSTPIHVTEKLLNHVSGTLGGIAGVYNRHSYMDEMRAAVTQFEHRLTA